MVRNGGILLLAAVGWPGTAGLDNGLGRLPALGWNSDYCTNCSAWNRSSPGARFTPGRRREWTIPLPTTAGTSTTLPRQCEGVCDRMCGAGSGRSGSGHSLRSFSLIFPVFACCRSAAHTTRILVTVKGSQARSHVTVKGSQAR